MVNQNAYRDLRNWGLFFEFSTLTRSTDSCDGWWEEKEDGRGGGEGVEGEGEGTGAGGGGGGGGGAGR